MTQNQQFSLRWNNYLHHLTYAFETLRTEEDLVDVTLSCEGKKIRAHKILLSACSSYFKEVFKENPCQHPVIVFKNVKYCDLAAIIEFMYQGEVSVLQDALPSFLHTAELLAVKGLTENSGPDDKPQQTTTTQTITHTIPAQVQEKTILLALPADVARSTSGNTITIQSDTLQMPTTSSKARALIEEFAAGLQQQQLEQSPKRKKVRESTTSELYAEAIDTYAKVEESAGITEEDQNEDDDMEYLPQMKMELPEYIDVNVPTSVDGEHITTTTTITTPTETTSYIHGTYELVHETIQQADDKMDDDGTTTVTGEGKVDEVEKQTLRDENGQEIEMARVFDPNQAGSADEGKQDVVMSSKWAQCQFCKLIITSVNLWRHIRTQHTPQPPRNCEKCQKTFKNKYSLREHVRMAHEQKQTVTLASTP